MSIGLEYITKIFGGNYTAVAKKLDITPQTVSDWIREKRKIPQAKLEDLARLFNLNKNLFQKELSEIEKIEIEIDYLNRLSRKDTISVPETVEEDGVTFEIMREFNPHEHDIRVKYEELALQKLLLRLKGVLYNESFLSEFTLQKHFDLLNDICVSLEDDNYFELTNQGMEVRKSIPKVSALETLMHVLNNRNKLAFGSSKEDAFTLEMEALLHKYNLLNQDHELGIKEDPFFKDAEGH